ncbi:specifically androgen-regulated gene protein isoform X3 [Hyperolius riggenbachi]|uniref:specifically androgen-regulated gene protein isoform X3 n=1 Tax=Hyperolius riggenbachi TaxID=752182 RepID=UPI0035A37A99
MFDGDDYGHLSAEERECLMFLEETIESLDNEDDSGLSNDEVETMENVNCLPMSEPGKITVNLSSEMALRKTAAISKSEECINVDTELNTVPQRYLSFPRVVQFSREEIKIQPNNSGVLNTKEDHLKPLHEKSIRIPTSNLKQEEESKFLFLAPPECFTDPEVIRKRHSVTDTLLKTTVIFEHDDKPDAMRLHSSKVPPPIMPRESSLKTNLPGSSETLNQVVKKTIELQLKQAPPTAPKPRILPAHIIIKTGKSDLTNPDPMMRPRTLSTHEKISNINNESVVTKVTQAIEQERARHEALQKLGLEESSSQKKGSIKLTYRDLPLASGGTDQGKKDAKKMNINKNYQHKLDSTSTLIAQSSDLTKQLDDHMKNELNSNNMIHAGAESGSLEKTDEPLSAAFLMIQKENNTISSSSITDTKSGMLEKNTPSTKTNTPFIPEKSFSLSLNDNFSKNVKSGPDKASENVPKVEQIQKGELRDNKAGSLESVNTISKSPGNSFTFITQHSPKAVQKEGKYMPATDKSKRHSAYYEDPSESYLRLPQSSVPGVRQINIKSNTLERTGMGLSSSLSNIEKDTQKGSSSIFRKPLLTGNFLRNNRPRPASLGTGKEFASLESSLSDLENPKKNSFFSRLSHPSAPVTSVKITPKGSTDEHRREALKKLGILKE